MNQRNTTAQSHHPIRPKPAPLDADAQAATIHRFIAEVRQHAKRLDSKEILAAQRPWEAATLIALTSMPTMSQVLQCPTVRARWVRAEILSIAEQVLTRDLNNFRAHLRMARHSAVRAAEDMAESLGLSW